MFMMFLFLQNGLGGLIWSLLPLFIVILIFYLLVIVPHRRQQRELAQMIESLKINDEVITSGGIIGKIKEIRDTTFVILSAEKSFIEIGKNAVIGKREEKK
ncbi:MAG: preprotein translocase subunit YajC [Acidobacteria bacterium]|nr:MAG: preprotein translocase subunit YajC [Acidobacteriota bacterium]